MYTPSDAVLKQVQNSFTYHAPQGSQVQRYAMLRDEAARLASAIIYNTPASREQSLALTKLEEAIMHANAAIARHEVWDGNKMLAPLQLTFEPVAG